jgi:hypothetical protein
MGHYARNVSMLLDDMAQQPRIDQMNVRSAAKSLLYGQKIHVEADCASIRRWTSTVTPGLAELELDSRRRAGYRHQAMATRIPRSPLMMVCSVVLAIVAGCNGEDGPTSFWVRAGWVRASD